tara:strand:- start:743 stop:1189 length:447 start_codon:yes stop_codon:yes gene_type:complete
MNENTLVKNRIFASIVNKVKRLRKSFRKKTNSDDLLNTNMSRTLTNLQIDLESMSLVTSESKTYVKSNNSNYSRRDNSLDLIRDDNGNHEIVLPYQRFTYKKKRKSDVNSSECLKLKFFENTNSLDMLRINVDRFENISLNDTIDYNK